MDGMLELIPKLIVVLGFSLIFWLNVIMVVQRMNADKAKRKKENEMEK